MGDVSQNALIIKMTKFFHEFRSRSFQFLLFTLSIFGVLDQPGFASDLLQGVLDEVVLPFCSQDSQEGDSCKVEVSTLRPTQFAVGMRLVHQKELEIENLISSPNDLRNYLKKHPEPVILGPEGRFYIVDHHHLARALMNANIELTYAQVLANFSNLSTFDFWQRMNEKGWVFPYDENGMGPLPFSQIPESVAELKDDPYRSLSGEVRARGGYVKSKVFYADSLWANFFRPRIKITPGNDGFESAIAQAIVLARSNEAKNLPGYIGNQK